MQKLTRLLPALALAIAVAGSASAQGVRILGRAEVNPAGGFVLQWPSSGFETTLIGKRLVATIDDYGDNWLNVEVDGVVSKLDLKEGTHVYTLFNGPIGEHTVRLTRRTGSPVGPTRILDVRAEAGRLAPTVAPEHRIMVIGDSITSGYGVEGADQTCSYTHATQNADLAYPALAAKAFGADLHSISIDGRGLIRNYAGDDPTMDTASWRMLPGSTKIWPAAAYQPQAIVINLGTNDFADGDPGDAFDAAYIGLIRKLRTAYPEAVIFAGFGPMLSGQDYAAARASVFGSVEAVRADGDKQVFFIEFTPPSSGRRYGCSWHPGLDAQKAMAVRLQTSIRKELGWGAAPAETPSEDGSPLLVWKGEADDTLAGAPSTFSVHGSFR